MTRDELRAELDERAAIIEFDGGLSRADAEARAVAEHLDRGLLELPGILGELARADRRRAHSDLADVLTALGLADVRGPSWGFDHVMAVADRETYRLAIAPEIGHAAFIVPAVAGGEDGGIADLVACTVTPQRMRSRLGVAAVVGLDQIEMAREADAPLLVFDNTIRWLRGGGLGAVVIDWEKAPREFEGVTIILCAEGLASRLREATRRCWPRPTIAYASEKKRHAA